MKEIESIEHIERVGCKESPVELYIEDNESDCQDWGFEDLVEAESGPLRPENGRNGDAGGLGQAEAERLCKDQYDLVMILLIESRDEVRRFGGLDSDLWLRVSH